MDCDALTTELRAYLAADVASPTTQRRTARLLAQIVGGSSPISRERRADLYRRMMLLPFEQRGDLRRDILLESVPFAATVYRVLSKLDVVTISETTRPMLESRVVSIYGDRSTVRRGLSCALRTFVAMGIVERTAAGWRFCGGGE
jgi:hypothetical protein